MLMFTLLILHSPIIRDWVLNVQMARITMVMKPLLMQPRELVQFSLLMAVILLLSLIILLLEAVRFGTVAVELPSGAQLFIASTMASY